MVTETKKFTNYKMCTRCKGARRNDCCSSMGGAYSPSDIKNFSAKTIAEMLDCGSAQISTLLYLPKEKGKNNSRKAEFFLYLRTPEVGKEAIDLISPSTACAWWNPEKGCSIKTVSKRPYGCAAMEPKSSGKCIRHYNNNNILLDWGANQKALERVITQKTHKGLLPLLRQEAEKIFPVLQTEIKKYIHVNYLPPKWQTIYMYLLILGYKL